ncbi:MAG: 5-methyltetrahydropteroyltriglutamate--homocysteine methyltransferase [Hyphomicrobiales bacterium]|nr:5-methyltetrahydropteroyltriglutamate--homocysteine methyltransferase [Hyphomicrobiales bacterium]
MSSYRVDQIGSLIRPARLLNARDEFKNGSISRDALRLIEDDCVLEVLELQRAAGMSIFTDGEMRRDAWQTVFSEAVDGFEPDYPIREVELEDGRRLKLQMHVKAINGKLKQHKRLAQVDATFLRQHAPGPFKITMPSPAVVARYSYKRGITDAAYPDVAELQRDVCEIVKQEMQALVNEGARYLQLDEGFTIYAEPERMRMMANVREDPEQALERDIALENACYDAVRKEGVTLAMHLCRGSRAGIARGRGDYDWLAMHLFDRLHVDRFLLEYDNETRVGGFEPLRHMPKGKVAVLGLVSSADPKLENQDDLLSRIDEASKFCSLDQLAISSQCGFQGAGSRDGAHMTIDDEKRKLELLADTARKVWG